MEEKVKDLEKKLAKVRSNKAQVEGQLGQLLTLKNKLDGAEELLLGMIEEAKQTPVK